MAPATIHRQRGAAALGVVLLLLAALALAVGMAHRNLLFEQRSSANQLRSTRAFEAAEAGLAWAQAQLNRSGAIGADCEAASAAPGDTDFRTRYLAFDAATGRFAPRSFATPDGPRALQAACVATDTGWSCRCPADAAPVLDEATGAAPQPAFFVRFDALPRAGMVQVVATGCDQLGAACRPGPTGAHPGAASAQVQATLALLPALATLPPAALTAGGTIDAGGALELVNQDASTEGLTARAGGAIALPLAQLVTLPGRSVGDSLSANAPALSGLQAERLLTRLLGIDRARWRALPGVRNVDCSAECAARLAASDPRTLVWITGDLALDGPITVGSAERPMLLVVEGQLRLQGAVSIHGVVVTLDANWDTSSNGGGARVEGAVVALGDVRGSGSLAIERDAALLDRLHREVGHFARVAGSWRDF